MDLADVIKKCKDGEIYKATFAIDQHWYISKIAGFIFYCDKNGIAFDLDLKSAVPLTYSNLRAEYELVSN